MYDRVSHNSVLVHTQQDVHVNQSYTVHNVNSLINAHRRKQHSTPLEVTQNRVTLYKLPTQLVVGTV